MTDDRPAAPKLTSDTPHRRVFLDREGRQWTVYEAAVPYDRRGTVSLIFESADIVRRVRNYPPDWHEWPGAALLELSTRA